MPPFQQELSMSWDYENWLLTCSSEVKASACKAGDLGSIPGLGRSPGEGNGNPLQYSCLENPMDGGAWYTTVHGIAKSQTQLSDLNFTFSTCERAFQVALVVKNLPVNAGDIRDMGSIPGSGRSPGGGHGNPLQYSCLKNPVDRGTWWATVHRVTKSQRGLKRLSMQPMKKPQLPLELALCSNSILLALPSLSGGQPAAFAAPSLSLLPALNKLTPIWNTVCLEILFQPTLRMPWQKPEL